jgi:hypothetical protein
MVFFIVIKIAIVSLLLIYVAHLVWGYYTMDTETNPSGSGQERTNSALRDSKRMYEEMARAIQLGERPQPIDTLVVPPHIATNEHIIPPHESVDKETMQEELKAFMDNMT